MNNFPLREKVGHIMIIKCGHNGYFSFEENDLYEKHLQKVFDS